MTWDLMALGRIPKFDGMGLFGYGNIRWHSKIWWHVIWLHSMASVSDVLSLPSMQGLYVLPLGFGHRSLPFCAS